jgi:hypothetical protein
VNAERDGDAAEDLCVYQREASIKKGNDYMLCIYTCAKNDINERTKTQDGMTACDGLSE